MESQEKIMGIMDYLQTRGLWTNTFYDMIVGSTSCHEIEKNHGVEIYLPEKDAKAFNSVLTFSIMTALIQPRASLLYTGGPGVGKTTVAEFVGYFLLGEDINKIQDCSIHCHPELTEEKMIARLHSGKLLDKGEEEVRWRNFCDCPVHILDEVNRLPPGKKSILYNLIDRGIARYMDDTKRIADGPIYATANYEDEGTFKWDAPFVDRFGASVKAPVPNSVDFEYIFDEDSEDVKAKWKLANNKDMTLEQLLAEASGIRITDELRKELEGLRDHSMVFSEKERNEVWRAITNTKFDEDASNYLEYIAAQINFCLHGASTKHNLCAPAFMNKGSCENKKPDELCGVGDCHYNKTQRVCSYTSNEFSVRGMESTHEYAKTFAWLLGQEKVTVDVVKEILPFVARHRLNFTESLRNTINTSTSKVDTGILNDSTASVRAILDGAEKSYQEAGEIFDSWSLTNDFYELIKKQNRTKGSLETFKKELKEILSQERKENGTKHNEDPLELMSSLDKSEDPFNWAVTHLEKVFHNTIKRLADYDDPIKFSFAGWLQKIYLETITPFKKE